jgi:pimeloyl-ACP methyl ester carboxylesterase
MWLTARALKARPLWKLPFVFGRLTNDVDATKINRWADALLAGTQVRRDAARVIKAFGPNITNAAARSLRSTALPFLVVWGADDKAFRPALAERFCREVATAELTMIEDCKALVCWDQPERLSTLIADFVERTVPAPSNLHQVQETHREQS